MPTSPKNEALVFNFDDYREFLSAYFGPSGTRRGRRLEIAKTLDCHSSYLTRVMEGVANLSLEQGFKLTTHLKLAPNEADYLLLLIQHARAGTPELRHHLDGKIQAMKQTRLQLKERVTIKESLSRESQATYYSSWHYAAVHVALTIPSLRTRAALSKYFGVPEKRIADVLEFLQEVGLASEESGIYQVGKALLHLEGNSPNVSKHHSNWRTQAVVSLDRSQDTDLHYSAVMTVSKKNAVELREKLVKVVRDTIEFVSQSKDESEVICLNLDWFLLSQ